MPDATAAEIAATLGELARQISPLVQTGCRLILPADVSRLTPREKASFAATGRPATAASGAARLLARGLLWEGGYGTACDILRHVDGVPAWPAGVAGSLAHDDRFAVAAIAPVRRIAGLGIDIEPRLGLPEDVLDLVLTRAERAYAGADRLLARRLFVLKEAVYKAVYPLDRVFLEPTQVVVASDLAQATTSTGWHVSCHSADTVRIVALAMPVGRVGHNTPA